MTGTFDPVDSVDDVHQVLQSSESVPVLLHCIDFCIRADRPDLRFRLAKTAHEIALQDNEGHLDEATRAHLSAYLGQAPDLGSLPAQISAGLTWLADHQASSPPAIGQNAVSDLRRTLEALRQRLADRKHETIYELRGRRITTATTLRRRFNCPRPARELADLVIADHPRNTFGLVQVGAALIDLGQDDDAIRFLRRALSIEPENKYARSSLGKALQRRGEPDDLDESLELALLVFAEDPGAGNARRLRSIARALGDADAIAMAESQIVSAPRQSSETDRRVLDLDTRLYDAINAKDRTKVQEVRDTAHELLLGNPAENNRPPLRDLRREASLFLQFEEKTTDS